MIFPPFSVIPGKDRRGVWTEGWRGQTPPYEWDFTFILQLDWGKGGREKGVVGFQAIVSLG